MGKNEKTGLGRALVKHHNQMIQQSKEKGRSLRNHHKKILESITDVSDIDAVIQNAEESDRFSDLPSASPADPIKLDVGSGFGDLTEEEKKNQRKVEEALHAGSLRVPRRPPWDSTTSAEELDENEQKSFLVWRRGLARLEENENLILTPFEKNLDIWRQLWRVVERSDLLVMVVDARDPLFYRCPDLEAYAQEVDRHKRTLLLVNKADLLPVSLREKWAEFFQNQGILFLFWSAKAATAALEGRKIASPWITQDKQRTADDPHLKIYGREELLARLQAEAEEIVKLRRESGSGGTDLSDARVASGQTASKSVTVGFVGYPNVGKSSTINALVGQKRTGVTSTPGKTKHFQTLIISEELTLCDCPGLVFPSFSSSRHEMIACGVLPIDRMTEHREAIQVVANRVPRHVVEDVYNIKLPKPKPYEPQNRPPLASELLRTYCASRGYVGSSGLPDETRAARQILKDYIDGKLPHFELPPGTSSEENNEEEAADSRLPEIPEGEKSDLETSGDSENEVEGALVLDRVLNDLNSFDMESGLSSRKPSMKKPTTSHKHHKKVQRKKDRSWRVGNDDGDGMPVVRAFQKPVNRGPEVTR
ncbi:hypothetical protein MLD38_025345 [Melastoma candidum]|uniref:Uncharacterized protein n=1 Tax=Melastoma candidum TaxID=119954 RepID=A0ACB9NXZ4_9MYRT|nr:hypothetical protein MLD38_025345 [Melastoma candidum]